MKKSLIHMPVIVWALLAGTSLSAVHAFADETSVTDPSGEPGVSDEGNAGSGEEPSNDGTDDGSGAGNDDGGGIDPGGNIDDGTPVDDNGSGIDGSVTIEDAGGDPGDNGGYDPTIAQSGAAETADGGLKSNFNESKSGTAGRMSGRDSGETQWLARKPRRSLFGSNSPWSERTARKAP